MYHKSNINELHTGTVYLLHFDKPLGNPANTRALARHYLGWAVDLDKRLNDHRAGRGAAITRAALEQGISFACVATWPGDYLLERHLKALKSGPRLCPICGKRHPRGRMYVHLDYVQLPLPLLDDDLGNDVWPDPPARPTYDWLYIQYLRGDYRPTPSPIVLPPREPLIPGSYDIPF